jgi:hypothetical protein
MSQAINQTDRSPEQHRGGDARKEVVWPTSDAEAALLQMAVMLAEIRNGQRRQEEKLAELEQALRLMKRRSRPERPQRARAGARGRVITALD